MKLPRYIYQRLAVGILALVGLLAAIDVVALQVAESQGSAELARGMAAESASLDLGGFPFLPGFLGGELDGVSFSASGPSGGGLRIASVQARAGTLRFESSEAFALLRSRHSTRTGFVAGDVFGRLEVTSADLERFVEREVPEVAALRLTPSGITVTFGGADGEEQSDPARFIPRVEEVERDGRTIRTVVLRLVGRAGLPSRFRKAAESLEEVMRLPEIPEGLQTSINMGDGLLTIEGSGPEARFSLGEGQGTDGR